MADDVFPFSMCAGQSNAHADASTAACAGNFGELSGDGDSPLVCPAEQLCGAPTSESHLFAFSDT